MIDASYNSTIVGNSFERNPTAISFDGESLFSIVYNNNFVNNTNHVVSFAVNYFDADYPSWWKLLERFMMFIR